ncbi:MAG: hypothetical protein AAGF81_10825 [Pseudomonadota bacterium]
MMMRAFGVLVCLTVLTAAGRPAAAAPCVADALALDRLQQSLQVELEHNRVAAGEAVRLTWQAGDAKRNFPVYLMVSFDRPVDFKGPHVTALEPGASGPFGTAWNQDHTRALVPLYKEGQGRGSFEIKVLATENVDIEWSVFGYVGSCPSFSV